MAVAENETVCLRNCLNYHEYFKPHKLHSSCAVSIVAMAALSPVLAACLPEDMGVWCLLSSILLGPYVS